MDGRFVAVIWLFKLLPEVLQLFLSSDKFIKSTIDSRSIYALAMSTVFDVDFKKINKEVFWGEDLQNLSDKLFKAWFKYNHKKLLFDPIKKGK